MTIETIPPEDVERIVGHKRHPTRHYGRTSTTDETLSILHSEWCRNHHTDLRQCLYSIALTTGIDPTDWVDHHNRAVPLSLTESPNGSVMLTPTRFHRVTLVTAGPDFEDREYTLECPGAPWCEGFQECRDPHTAPGVTAEDAADGPYQCVEGSPIEDQEDFSFHGVLHTWRDGWGWTTPLPEGQCAVKRFGWWSELAADELAMKTDGVYDFAATWGDEELERFDLVDETQLPGTPVRGAQ